MQRVPQVDRKIDDRHVDRADQHQDRAGAVGTVLVLDGAGQRHVAKIHEQQDQRRGHPGVPGPVGAPGGLAPQRAGPQRDGRHQRPGRRQRGDHHRRHPGAVDQVQHRIDRHHQIDEHRHPGGRDVDEDDPVDLALLEVGRGHEQAQPQAGQAGEHGSHGKPRDQFSGQRMKALRGGIAEQVHSSEVLRARATTAGPAQTAASMPAPSRARCGAKDRPALYMSSTPLPKISTGT